jgi:hypothetical protein
MTASLIHVTAEAAGNPEARIGVRLDHVIASYRIHE